MSAARLAPSAIQLATEPAVLHSKRHELDGQVLHLFALVSEGLAAATEAFLAGDRDAARPLVAVDPLLDSLQARVEDLVRDEVFAGGPADEAALRHLIVVLQIVPELERSGDLVQHIAARASHGLIDELTHRAKQLIREMGKIVTEMWREAAVAFLERDAAVAARLRERDDDVDDIHVSLTAELAGGALPVAVAIEMGLVARFYERLGDHAVNVTRRLSCLATGGARDR